MVWRQRYKDSFQEFPTVISDLILEYADFFLVCEMLEDIRRLRYPLKSLLDDWVGDFREMIYEEETKKVQLRSGNLDFNCIFIDCTHKCYDSSPHYTWTYKCGQDTIDLEMRGSSQFMDAKVHVVGSGSYRSLTCNSSVFKKDGKTTWKDLLVLHASTDHACKLDITMLSAISVIGNEDVAMQHVLNTCESTLISGC